MIPLKRLRWPMHVHLSTLFAALFVILAAASAVQRYRVSTQMLESSVGELLKVVNREANEQLERFVESATLATSVISRTTLGQATGHEARVAQLQLLQEALRASSSLGAIYVGYGNGDMFLLRRLRTGAEVQAFQAPAGTRYILQSIDRSGPSPRGRYVYMDEELHILREDDRPDYAASYDPRSRGWYQEAFNAGALALSEPYVFFSTRRLGMTISAPVENTRSVVGSDIQLDSLGALFKQIKVTPGTQLALALPDGTVLVSTGDAGP